MDTKELIKWLRDIDEYVDTYNVPNGGIDDGEAIAAIIGRLEEYDELMKCKVMTVDGKWKKSGK